MSLRTTSAFLAIALSACAATPTAPPAEPPAAEAPLAPAAPPEPPAFRLAAASFAELPDWATSDAWPALSAFRRHCETLSRKPADAPLGGQYGGLVREWLPACQASLSVQPGQERWFFETYFYPARVEGPGEARLTGYYEPVIEARRAPEAPFLEPLLRRPNDMVTIDLGAFADARDDGVLRGAPRSLTGRISGDRVEPYPRREAISPAPGQAIAFAHPADVYNLQVQGSGRLRFPDGSQTRANFAAQNGYPWRSALGALRSAGMLASATWSSFRIWIDNNPDQSRGALNADPSYVFFAEEPITDPAMGPRGAAGIPLTPMGSIAVDPAFHPYGAIVFVDGTHRGRPFRRAMVAQDTGGAIRRGPQRGDVFFGSGPGAGAEAEQMNGPAQWWTLLPRPVEARIAQAEVRGYTPASYPTETR